MAYAQSIKKVGEAGNVHVSGGSQAFDPGGKKRGIVRAQSSVGAKCRKDERREAGRGKLLVMFQRVRRIVRGANRIYMKHFQDAMHRHIGFGKSRVGAVPDGGGRSLVQQIVDSEIPEQFQVGPVIKGIAERVRDSARPRQKLVKRRGAAGAEFLTDAVRAHGPPLVVVAVEPDFREIVKPAIFSNFTRRQMAVKIEDGKRLGMIVEETTSRFSLKQKIFRDKSHSRNSFPSRQSHDIPVAEASGTTWRQTGWRRRSRGTWLPRKKAPAVQSARGTDSRRPPAMPSHPFSQTSSSCSRFQGRHQFAGPAGRS